MASRASTPGATSARSMRPPSPPVTPAPRRRCGWPRRTTARARSSSWAPHLDVGCGFIELAQPDLDTAMDDLVAGGATSVVAVPLVLLGAGHLKNDGPNALHRARTRHPSVEFAYARDLGIHPLVLGV